MIPAILACGLTNTVTDAVTGGDTFKPAAQLWSDVPPMPGLTPSELEDVPLPIKLLMRTVLANLGQDANARRQPQHRLDLVRPRRHAGGREQLLHQRNS